MFGTTQVCESSFSTINPSSICSDSRTTSILDLQSRSSICSDNLVSSLSWCQYKIHMGFEDWVQKKECKIFY